MTQSSCIDATHVIKLSTILTDILALMSCRNQDGQHSRERWTHILTTILFPTGCHTGF